MGNLIMIVNRWINAFQESPRFIILAAGLLGRNDVQVFEVSEDAEDLVQSHDVVDECAFAGHFYVKSCCVDDKGTDVLL